MSHILITYGTRALAQRLQNSISQHVLSFATCEEVPSIFAHKYHKIPHAANPTFTHELLKLCLDQHIDFVLPLYSAELISLKNTGVLFGEYNIQILVPKHLDKVQTIENPPSDYPLQVFSQGKSLLSDTVVASGEETGLYALVDGDWVLVVL